MSGKENTLTLNFVIPGAKQTAFGKLKGRTLEGVLAFYNHFGINSAKLEEKIKTEKIKYETKSGKPVELAVFGKKALIEIGKLNSETKN